MEIKYNKSPIEAICVKQWVTTKLTAKSAKIISLLKRSDLIKQPTEEQPRWL